MRYIKIIIIITIINDSKHYILKRKFQSIQSMNVINFIINILKS